MTVNPIRKYMLPKKKYLRIWSQNKYTLPISAAMSHESLIEGSWSSISATVRVWDENMYIHQQPKIGQETTKSRWNPDPISGLIFVSKGLLQNKEEISTPWNGNKHGKKFTNHFMLCLVTIELWVDGIKSSLFNNHSTWLVESWERLRRIVQIGFELGSKFRIKYWC